MMKTCLTIALLAAAPAVAQETFALPAGCEAYVTVQKRGCVVTHLFRCEADPADHQRRVDLAEEGMTYIGRIDAETQWIESFSPGTGSTNRLGPEVADAASFSQLTQTGRDTFEFETTSDVFGVTRYVGFDELTGSDIEIDGVTLLGTAFSVVAYGADGAESWRVEGNEFIVPEWRSFMSGIRTITSDSGVNERNNTPVDFTFPWVSGFLAAKPIYDCSVVLSSYEVRQ